MSAVKAVLNNQIQNIISFFNISCNYFKRRNPFMQMVIDSVQTIAVFMSIKKRLRALKYQVRLMHYRMHQMEKLIAENNQHNSFGRGSIDKYR